MLRGQPENRTANIYQIHTVINAKGTFVLGFDDGQSSGHENILGRHVEADGYEA